HVLAVRALRSYFGGDGRNPEVVAIADVDPEAAEQAARAYGVDRWTADWRSLVEDDQIDMITIAVPNDQHETVAVAAAKAGKHVMSEKPLANTVESGRRMLEAVEEAGVVHSVNLNYRSIPAIRYARELISQGVIGEIVGVRGTFLQDWGLDPSIPRSWKFEKSRSGGGPMLSLGCHLVDLVHFLVGHIAEVVATTSTLIEQRPLPTGRDTYAAQKGPVEMAPVDIDDSGAFLLRTGSGVAGVLELSRIHSGRQNFCTIEVSGTEGAIAFDYERLNELQLSNRHGPGGGFTRIIVGPAQDGGLVWTLGGLGVGFAETIIVHFRELMEAVYNGTGASPSFADGLRAQEVIHAAMVSAETRSWETVAPVG
ncbi:MAG TPA: Gfo/Idh/MocA family oxidoreductase, partial [Acidimicrobiia bacterium]|nr:Gfo/Idh/MocA family oxidoreductase [Acidimicrobiia bacterium]